MAVSRVVLLVFVVAVTQAECASISKPELLDHNQVDDPESTDILNITKNNPHDVNDGIPLESQVKVKQDDSDKIKQDSNVNSSSSDSILNNSHTITSQDFAEMTGVVSPQVPEGNEVDPKGELDPPPINSQPEGTTDVPPDKEIQSNDSEEKLTETTSINDVPEYSKTDDKEENKDAQPPEEQINSSDKKESSVDKKESSVDKTEESSVEDEKKSTEHDNHLQQISLYELFQNLTDEFKQYSNIVAINWENIKGGASWTPEAESVLKDYMDKISIVQSLNNSKCIEKDLENYAARSKSIQDAMNSCRSELKREEWHKLQENTKSTLNKITEIEQNTTDSISKLPKEDPNYYINKTDIENKAKVKLQEINSLKDKFSNLMEKAIENDKSEYISCLDNKPEKGMIVDTYNDIMRIKNNCVG